VLLLLAQLLLPLPVACRSDVRVKGLSAALRRSPHSQSSHPAHVTALTPLATADECPGHVVTCGDVCNVRPRRRWHTYKSHSCWSPRGACFLAWLAERVCRRPLAPSHSCAAAAQCLQTPMLTDRSPRAPPSWQLVVACAVVQSFGAACVFVAGRR
jgi:hypothetical protein